jgi:hypothetical protein
MQSRQHAAISAHVDRQKRLQFPDSRDLRRRAGVMLQLVTKSLAARGGPFLTFLDPAALAEQLRELGFVEVRDLGEQEPNTRTLRIAPPASGYPWARFVSEVGWIATISTSAGQAEALTRCATVHVSPCLTNPARR